MQVNMTYSIGHHWPCHPTCSMLGSYAQVSGNDTRTELDSHADTML